MRVPFPVVEDLRDCRGCCGRGEAGLVEAEGEAAAGQAGPGARGGEEGAIGCGGGAGGKAKVEIAVVRYRRRVF